MKKYVLDLTVRRVEPLSSKHVLIRLTHAEPLPEMLPGQFAELRIDGSSSAFLRRPISIHYVDREQNELWLMVAMVGDGTRWLGTLKEGDLLNCVLPLGNSFTMPATAGPATSADDARYLLIGGGVGVAPLLFLGAQLKSRGVTPTFLLGGRSRADLLELEEFAKYGDVYVTTEDGSMGEQGFVTNHSVLAGTFDRICTCGPTPMMKAVARYAKERGICCEASLENLMACGLGACLCCVEKTTDGHLCVCQEGPVFDVDRLLWD